MSELSKTKLNYIFITISLVSLVLLNWSIVGLDPEKNAIEIGSLELGRDPRCLNFNGIHLAAIEIDHSLEELFTLTGKGSFKLGQGPLSSSFSTFATFDPLGKLFGAKLNIDIGGRVIEILLKGSENTEMTVSLTNSTGQPVVSVFHVEGPLLFVNPENLKIENRADFSILANNMFLKQDSILNLKKQISERVTLESYGELGACKLTPLLKAEGLTKFGAIFDKLSNGKLNVYDEIIKSLDPMVN